MKKVVIIIIAVVFLAIGYRLFMFTQMGGGHAMPTPIVEITTPKKVEIYNKIETVGRVSSPNKINMIATVSGFLKKRFFKSGDYVKKGQLLFEIDRDAYLIKVNQTTASLENTKAALSEAEKNLERSKELVAKDFISKSEYDRALANRDQLKASLGVQKANLAKAKLDLSYTRITAEVDGRIGRALVHNGNFVDRSSGPLATLVSLDPVYVYYDLRSEDYIKLKKSGKDSSYKKVDIILPDGSLYEHKGLQTFYDNNINETTGTIKARAEVKNPDHLLIPGQYVNVAIHSNNASEKITIPQEAVLENAAGRFLYILSEDNTANIRPIKTCGQQNGNWIVQQGLSGDEKVVLKGVQKIHPQMKVKIKDTAESSENIKHINKSGGKPDVQ